MYQNVRAALVNLLAARQRTLLALIGIVIGSSSVIAMVNIGYITEQEALEGFRALGTDVISVRLDGDRTVDAQGVERLMNRVPALTIVAPIMKGFEDVTWGRESVNTALFGVNDDFYRLSGPELASGRYPSDLLDGYSLVAVIGAYTAEALSEGAGRDLTPGDQVYIYGRSITIVGILEPRAFNQLINVRYNFGLFLPMKAFRRLSSNPVSTLVARRDERVDPALVASTLVNYFDNLPGSPSADVQTAEALIAQISRQTQLFTILLGAIGGISLIVGGIGIMNIMIASVSERRLEIGLRMAIGARRRDIRVLFLVESAVLGLVGGILGGILGVGAAWVFAHYNEYSFQVSWAALLVGPVSALFAGVFFGLYPAESAARLEPIDALRS